MQLDRKLGFLVAVYHTFETWAGDVPVSCKPGCADCCTRNVTATTLEAFYLLSELPEAQTWMEKINKIVDLPRFQPAMTLNTLASCLRDGGEPPEEVSDPAWWPCPFLDAKGLCGVYDRRPFGCRCFHSATACGTEGLSTPDMFIMTVSQVMLQFLEQVDQPGYAGNFIDLVRAMMAAGGADAYAEGRLSISEPGVQPCRSIPLLLVPPEDQMRIRPYLETLQRLYREWFSR
ncbi:MAG: hypothetical protein CSA22_08235 [Deltaproteobacteria bacterium]|nr:MAG: hypothetical protein CSA22_08235 [Deltaproteobacteria bacterium]